MKDLTLLREPPLWFVFLCIFHLPVSLLPQSLQNSAHALNVPDTRPPAIPVYDNRPLDDVGIMTRETDEAFSVMRAIRERRSRRVGREQPRDVVGIRRVIDRRQVGEDGLHLVCSRRCVLDHFEVEPQRWCRGFPGGIRRRESGL